MVAIGSMLTCSFLGMCYSSLLYTGGHLKVSVTYHRLASLLAGFTPGRKPSPVEGLDRAGPLGRDHEAQTYRTQWICAGEAHSSRTPVCVMQHHHSMSMH